MQVGGTTKRKAKSFWIKRKGGEEKNTWNGENEKEREARNWVPNQIRDASELMSSRVGAQSRRSYLCPPVKVQNT